MRSAVVEHSFTLREVQAIVALSAGGFRERIEDLVPQAVWDDLHERGLVSTEQQYPGGDAETGPTPAGIAFVEELVRDGKADSRPAIAIADELIGCHLEPPAWRDAFQRVIFDTADSDDWGGDRYVVVVAKGVHADRVAVAYERLGEGDDPLAGVVRSVIDEYRDDHNWAQFACERLELALHQADGCRGFRSDCDLCQAELEASLRRPPLEWATIDGVRILDPDGWRADCPLGAKSIEEPITRGEYEQRLSSSTVCPLPTEEDPRG